MVFTEQERDSIGVTGRTVLLVEDEPLLLEALGQEFESFGYAVLRAENGEEACKLLGESAPGIDLVVTDVRLPGALNGWDVAEEARRRDASLPVIYVTGYTDEAPRDVPGSVFVVKPYRPSLIIRAARRLGIS